MALGQDPTSTIPKALKEKSNNFKKKNKKIKNSLDLSEMEKENLKVLEDRKNLKENLKLKEER